MIKKKGNQFEVISESGRHMGTYSSEGQAKKRLAMIDWFKKHPNLNKK